MIKQIQSGPYINSVYAILDRFILKSYIDKRRSFREYTGLNTWWSCLPKITLAKQYLKIGQIGLFEKIEGESAVKHKDKEIIIKHLVQIYLNLLSNFRYHQKIEETDFLNWNKYLSDLIGHYENNKNLIKKFLKEREFILLDNTIKYLMRIDWSCQAKLPLHRDLHWGNIFYKEGHIRIIDFEHFCFGPLEFEFCNSIFWNDKYSIDFTRIIYFLKESAVDLNIRLTYQLVTIYFVDQFNLTLQSHEQNKLTRLIKKLRRFLRLHQKFLVQTEQETDRETLYRLHECALQGSKLPYIF